MNLAELKARGHAHQTAGTLDAELEREDSPAGRAYRDGMRQARRDAEDALDPNTQRIYARDIIGYVLGNTDAINPTPLGGSYVPTTPPGWNPPETAPTNGTPCDALMGDSIFTAKREGDQWYAASRTSKAVSWTQITAPDGWRSLTLAHVPPPQPGDVPDARLTILGASGKHAVVSLVGAWVRLAAEEP